MGERVVFMKINRKINRKLIIIFTTIILLFLVLWLIMYFSKSDKMKKLGCIAVDEESGCFAVSHYTTEPVVTVFDNEGNLLFSKTYDNAGTGIYNMVWMNGNLYLRLGRRGVTVLVDSEGNIISNAPTIEFPVNWRDGWKKEGSSYKKHINGIEYRYDYANFFEYWGTPIDRVFINNEKSEICVWQSA
jgi:hypothetical protein